MEVPIGDCESKKYETTYYRARNLLSSIQKFLKSTTNVVTHLISRPPCVCTIPPTAPLIILVVPFISMVWMLVAHFLSLASSSDDVIPHCNASLFLGLPECGLSLQVAETARVVTRELPEFTLNTLRKIGRVNSVLSLQSSGSAKVSDTPQHQRTAPFFSRSQPHPPTPQADNGRAPL